MKLSEYGIHKAKAALRVMSSESFDAQQKDNAERELELLLGVTALTNEIALLKAKCTCFEKTHPKVNKVAVTNDADEIYCGRLAIMCHQTEEAYTLNRKQLVDMQHNIGILERKLRELTKRD